jgi:hypothetical protein
MEDAHLLQRQLLLDEEYFEATAGLGKRMGLQAPDVSSIVGIFRTIRRGMKDPSLVKMVAKQGANTPAALSRQQGEAAARAKVLEEFLSREDPSVNGARTRRQLEWYGLKLAVGILASAYEEEW